MGGFRTNSLEKTSREDISKEGYDSKRDILPIMTIL
jgi:hypothetical protein